MKTRNARTVSTIGKHNITALYDDKLRASVRAVMSDIAWHAIDIVRVGNKDDAVHPPVILITAAASEIDNEAAQIAVQQIHDLMVQ